ncbi:hypothetical protein Tco_0169929 [Tanacetum coccineum]
MHSTEPWEQTDLVYHEFLLSDDIDIHLRQEESTGAQQQASVTPAGSIGYLFTLVYNVFYADITQERMFEILCVIDSRALRPDADLSDTLSWFSVIVMCIGEVMEVIVCGLIVWSGGLCVYTSQCEGMMEDYKISGHSRNIEASLSLDETHIVEYRREHIWMN